MYKCQYRLQYHRRKIDSSLDILYKIPAVGKRNLPSFKRKDIIERQLKTAN